MTNHTPRYAAHYDADKKYGAPKWMVMDTVYGYPADNRSGMEQEQAEKIAAQKNEHEDKMRSAPSHHAHTSTQRTGGTNWGRQGNSRESEAHCSCGWSATANGQTYAESISEIREHLKEMGVYTTQLEQTVYAHVSQTIDERGTIESIAARSEKTRGRVAKVLDKLIVSGHIIKTGDVYTRTDKWFSWND